MLHVVHVSYFRCSNHKGCKGHEYNPSRQANCILIGGIPVDGSEETFVSNLEKGNMIYIRSRFASYFLSKLQM